jgi:hypothetical protein
MNVGRGGTRPYPLRSSLTALQALAKAWPVMGRSRRAGKVVSGHWVAGGMGLRSGVAILADFVFAPTDPADQSRHYFKKGWVS